MLSPLTDSEVWISRATWLQLKKINVSGAQFRVGKGIYNMVQYLLTDRFIKIIYIEVHPP